MRIVKEDLRIEFFSTKNLRKELQRTDVGRIGVELRGFVRVLKIFNSKVSLFFKLFQFYISNLILIGQLYVLYI